MEEGTGRNTGSPGRWRGTRQPTTREGKVGPGRVAERLVLPGRPGNAGGGKEPQVEGMAQGSRLTGVADGLSPRKRAGMPDVITCTSEGDDPSGRRRQGVNRPDDVPAVRRKGASPVPGYARPARRPTPGNPRASRMIPLESPVPEIGTPGSESGGRKRAHGCRTAARRESAGRATDPLPATRLPSTLHEWCRYPFPRARASVSFSTEPSCRLA